MGPLKEIYCIYRKEKKPYIEHLKDRKENGFLRIIRRIMQARQPEIVHVRHMVLGKIFFSNTMTLSIIYR